MSTFQSAGTELELVWHNWPHYWLCSPCLAVQHRESTVRDRGTGEPVPHIPWPRTAYHGRENGQIGQNSSDLSAWTEMSTMRPSRVWVWFVALAAMVGPNV